MQDTQKTPTRILIVDDHPVVLSGCRALFANDGSIRIDEAGDAKSGHRAFVQKKPDVTIIDINLPDVSGFRIDAADSEGRSGCQNHHVQHE